MTAHVTSPRISALPVGTAVRIACAGFPTSGTVVRHGRDRNGIYTLVRLPDGSESRFHREYLRRDDGAEKPCDHDGDACRCRDLPEGKTCGDCTHFKRTCEWLIACKPDARGCDWIPSRFRLPVAT